MKRLALLAIILTSCDDRDPSAWACPAQLPAVAVTFPDGTTKPCHRLNCDSGCVEWVCREDAQQLSCRPTSAKEAL